MEGLVEKIRIAVDDYLTLTDLRKEILKNTILAVLHLCQLIVSVANFVRVFYCRIRISKCYWVTLSRPWPRATSIDCT